MRLTLEQNRFMQSIPDHGFSLSSQTVANKIEEKKSILTKIYHCSSYYTQNFIKQQKPLSTTILFYCRKSFQNWLKLSDLLGTVMKLGYDIVTLISLPKI